MRWFMIMVMGSVVVAIAVDGGSGCVWWSIAMVVMSLWCTLMMEIVFVICNGDGVSGRWWLESLVMEIFVVCCCCLGGYGAREDDSGG